MNTSKAILLNGFAGAGKTTIARMYMHNHPLSLMIEGDELIVNIGDWLHNEKEARKLVHILTKSMLTSALSSGHDIILPFLVTDADEVAEFERIANDCNAAFYEFYLATNREHAIERLIKRGTWGEAGAPPITEEDMPVIEELYDRMDQEVKKRPGQVHIKLEEGKPEATYAEVLRYIS